MMDVGFSFATKWKMIHLEKIVDDGLKIENSRHGLECVNVAQFSSPSKNTTFEKYYWLKLQRF